MTKLKAIAEQVIVVTGASSGIGRATAVMAAQRGAKVVVAARNGAALEELAESIRRAGGQALPVVTDVTDAEAVGRLAEATIDAFGRIDTWVNNAGVAIAAGLEHLPEADARRLFDVNFWGTVRGSLAALPHLRRDGGALINLGSMTSDVAAPYMGMYSASKQAIKAYTDALRIELKIDHVPVSVTLIKPAPIATPILEHQRNLLDRQATMPPPFYLPEDVARTILYAAEHPVRDLFVGGSARAGSVLGQVLPGPVDAATALLAPYLFKTREAKSHRSDNLYDISQPTTVRGDSHGRYAHSSIYTRARLNPLRAGSLMAAVGTGAMMLLTRRRV